MNINHKILTYITLLFVFIFTSCSENSNSVTKEETIKIDESAVIPLQEIEDESAYAILTILFDSITNGKQFDSTLIIPYPIIPEIKNTFSFPTNNRTPISEFFGEIKNRDSFMGFGVNSFKGSSEDSIYIVEQITLNKNKKWNASRFSGFALDSIFLAPYKTPEGINWKKIRSDGFGCIESYSLPIFDKEHKRCIISINVSCRGLLGNGQTYFLKKKNNIWYIVGRRLDYMS